MKILVTGGTGFIGSHTVVELQNKGYEVIIVDNLSNSDAKILDSIEKITKIKPNLETFDLIDQKKTANFFKKHNDINGIIHFAAHKAVGESVKEPLKYYRNNIDSLINVLQAMQDHQIQNIVFSSSCTVYGKPDNLPVSEETPLPQSNSPYGNTKKISEEIIQDVVKETLVKAINLRYFNPIGAHDSALIGELPTGAPTNLLPFITQTAIGEHNHLKIYGNNYKTPDGTAIRDYIHVVDVAKAHVIAIERMINKKMKLSLETFNLGTGLGFSVLEVINTFEKISGLKLNYKYVDRREGDIDKIWADSRLSNNILGWKAEYNLEDMVRSAWKWEQAYKGV
tara:strand:+ start:417 stop:1433 length:1017 start_codon:yes stop_codon:yes gene_type:complete